MLLEFELLLVIIYVGEFFRVGADGGRWEYEGSLNSDRVVHDEGVGF